MTTAPKGMILALCAYMMWSCFPFYFKQLHAYDSVEIIVHRVWWTFVCLLVFIGISSHWHFIKTLKDNPKWLGLTFVSGLLIATNWLTYVWAVNHDKILDASLGYFISPLMGIALSFFLLKEKLRIWQLLACALALIAVILQVIWLGVLPIVAISLAITFSFYGVLHKKTPLDAVSALFLETVLILPFCVIWLMTHDVASRHLSLWLSSQIGLLMVAGPVTLVPLLLYNKATKLLNFNTLSFMQYITPSSIFMIAIFYYHESFDSKRMIIFVLIWLGLIIYSIDLIKHRKVVQKGEK